MTDASGPEEASRPFNSPADPAPPTNAEREVSADDISLGKRLRQPRTAISIVLPIVVLVLVIRALPGFHLEALPGNILAANKWLLLAALGVYYLGFPLRGYRWTILLRGIGFRLGVRDASEIIFLSWLVNCLVPAKLGDIYRAYLLKINSSVSLSRTFGTVFIERVLDLFAIAVLGLASGFVSFRNGMPPAVQFVFALGAVVVLILGLGLFTLRNFGRRILEILPFPHSVLELYDKFEEGVFGAIELRQVPILGLVTGLIWATEAMRLFLVVEALGFPGVHLGISGSFFVALAGSLLTAVPFTPGGLGIVEAGVGSLLTIVYGVPPTEAATIVLVDRAISVLSIIVLGSLTYTVSPKRRGAGLRRAPGPAGAPT